MNLEFFIGIYFLVIGIVFLIGRVYKIEKMFGKLKKMQAFWGESKGSAIHYIFYVIVPIIVGIILIILNI